MNYGEVNMNYYDIKIYDRVEFLRNPRGLIALIVFREIKETELSLYIRICKKFLLELCDKGNEYMLVIE